MTSFWLATHPITATGTPARPGESAEVCVVGAGLTGLTTAVLLARTGRRVVLVEARSVGAVASGNTTAKLSLLQGSVLSELRRRHAAEVVQAYVESNRAGQEWLNAFLGGAGVAVEDRTAWTYASGPEGVDRLERELSAATAAGLAVTRDDATELPFPVAGAIRLDHQLQFHATAVLDALLSDFLAHGGVLHTGCRVRGLRVRERVELLTSDSAVLADHVVLATGTPCADRGGHFAILQPQRSYALDGRTCTLSAVCTHLGGVVSWNEAERSWDCPLHGSRFAADGTRLEGPAPCGLARLDHR
jgi:glycine/D-amino acid oxidase-like deaminating enzyme